MFNIVTVNLFLIYLHFYQQLLFRLILFIPIFTSLKQKRREKHNTINNK